MARTFTTLTVKLRVAADLAAQPDLPPALAAVRPLLTQASEAFAAADAAVRDAVEVWKKEAPEAAQAIAALAPVYDDARDVARAHLPGLVDDGVASSHTTAQETIEAAEALADVFSEQAEEEWASTLGPMLEATLAAAIQEVDEKARAGESEQRARAQRASAADTAWEELMRFRRLVRRAYGSSSRQYQSLRDRRAASPSAETSTTS